MDFIESLAIRLPDIEAQLSATDFRESNGLVVEVAAIHEGVTANFNRYPALELASSLPTWTSPYPRPVLLHHDPYSEAVGRVIGSRMAKEGDGTPFINLQLAVTDIEAIQRVRDQRYLTGSVGGKADKATCTICKADWSKASMFDLPCKHMRGKEYDGKLCMIDMAEISWKEYSFVNMPADERSSIRKFDDGDGASKGKESVDFHSARFFCLDLGSERVSEFAESTTRDVLSGLEQNAAASLYHALKGAFLSAVAAAESDTKEDDRMTVKPPELEADEDDVLAAAEALSADLAAEHDPEPAADEPAAEEPATEPEPAAEPAPDDEDPDPVGEPVVDPTLAAEEPDDGEDADEPEAPAAADDEGDSEEGDEPAQADQDEAPGEGEESDGTDGGANIATLEARVTALEARETELVAENGRLRIALKRGLAERVVDTKIALELHTPEERETLLEEHMKRSASSLADTLRDLAALPAQQRAPWEAAPQVDPSGLAVPGAENDRDEIVEEDPAASSRVLNPEDLFVDVLMNRRSL